jgi:hypothetical protein
MTKIIEGGVSLIEALVKTTYQVVICKEPSFQDRPIAWGAGFFLNFRGELFFITADHNIHIEDHNKNERTGVDNYLAILNNISDKSNLSTMVTPIGGFYYLNSYDLSKEDLSPQLVDVAVSMVNRSLLKEPFLTEAIFNSEKQLLVRANEAKFELVEESLCEPQESATYAVYGKTRPQFKGLFVHREDTIKNNLKYVGTFKGFLLLNTDGPIIYEDWAGLSGSPVLDEEGRCVGMLCSVNEGTNAVFVKPMSAIKVVLEALICQKHNNEQNNQMHQGS